MTSTSDLCRCDCHTMRNVHHSMPCCYQCPHCRNNIDRLVYDQHVEECEVETKELLEHIGEYIQSFAPEGIASK